MANLGWDYYFNIASAGLLYKDANGNYIDTDSFKDLFKDDENGTAVQKQNEAKKIIKDEATNNSDAKGSDC